MEKKIRTGNARNLSKYFPVNSVDAIVTEPSLGPPLKRRPDYRTANEIVKNVTPLYKSSLSEMLKVLKKDGTIVVVSPAFRAGRGMVRVLIEDIAKNLGARLVSPLKEYGKRELMDFEERHNTLREINIIRKI